jgi:hypothetical protein
MIQIFNLKNSRKKTHFQKEAGYFYYQSDPAILSFNYGLRPEALRPSLSERLPFRVKNYFF